MPLPRTWAMSSNRRFGAVWALLGVRDAGEQLEEEARWSRT